LRRIDCVEIESKVVEAARYFETENLGILHHKEFHLIIDDGRNYVEHTHRTYDVISSVPSNLWMSGVANLFTREFFLAAKSRLRPGGTMGQWIHLYQISPPDVFVFLKTFQSVFPHISIWIDGSDMIVLGSDRPFRVDLATLQRGFEGKVLQENLVRSNLRPENIIRHYLGDEQVLRPLRRELPLNTDDRPVLEFSAPRSLFWDHSREIIADLLELRKLAREDP
jgi:spermidine synthase